MHIFEVCVHLRVCVHGGGGGGGGGWSAIVYACVCVCMCDEIHASVGLCKDPKFLLLSLFAAWKDYCHIIQVDCEQCTYQLMSYSYLLGKQFLFSIAITSVKELKGVFLLFMKRINNKIVACSNNPKHQH